MNISNKSLALLSAALLFLDFASTSVVSAATAMSYLAGEVVLPFPEFVGVILVFVIFTIVSLSGIKESARVALCVLSFHMTAMTILIIAGFMHWAKLGNAQITRNWHDGKASSAAEIAKNIFNGVCLGMLGLTGFECRFTICGLLFFKKKICRYSCVHCANQAWSFASSPAQLALSCNRVELLSDDIGASHCPTRNDFARG